MLIVYQSALSSLESRKSLAKIVNIMPDKGEEDIPAQRLYESLGEREDVFHYDIDVD